MEINNRVYKNRTINYIKYFESQKQKKTESNAIYTTVGKVE